jgi:hypothetical protein
MRFVEGPNVERGKRRHVLGLGLAKGVWHVSTCGRVSTKISHRSATDDVQFVST